MMNPVRRICLRHCLAFLYGFLGVLAVLAGIFYILSEIVVPWGIVYPLIGFVLLAIAWAFARPRRRVD